METAVPLTRSLKDWLKNRPRLEIEETATWFLLLFAYAHGLSEFVVASKLGATGR